MRQHPFKKSGQLVYPRQLHSLQNSKGNKQQNLPTNKLSQIVQKNGCKLMRTSRLLYQVFCVFFFLSIYTMSQKSRPQPPTRNCPGFQLCIKGKLYKNIPRRREVLAVGSQRQTRNKQAPMHHTIPPQEWESERKIFPFWSEHPGREVRVKPRTSFLYSNNEAITNSTEEKRGWIYSQTLYLSYLSFPCNLSSFEIIWCTSSFKLC